MHHTSSGARGRSRQPRARGGVAVPSILGGSFHADVGRYALALYLHSSVPRGLVPQGAGGGGCVAASWQMESYAPRSYLLAHSLFCGRAGFGLRLRIPFACVGRHRPGDARVHHAGGGGKICRIVSANRLSSTDGRVGAGMARMTPRLRIA